MAERLTRNVSLPARQNAFVEAMVAGGRYRTASEVVREGLRLLEEAEHRRLLETWLLEVGSRGVSQESQARSQGVGQDPRPARLEPELLDRLRAQVQAVLEGVGSAGEGPAVAGSERSHRVGSAS